MVVLKREEYIEYLTNCFVQSRLKQMVSNRAKLNDYVAHASYVNKWLGILPFLLHFIILKKHKYLSV